MHATTADRIATLEAELAAERERVAELTEERDLLRASHERLRLELELLRRRIFVAKAERMDTAQLELEFATKLAALDLLGSGPPPAPELPARETRKATGRRDLRNLKLPVERVEMLESLFEKLVARPSGSASRRAARSPGSAAAPACSSSPARSTASSTVTTTR